MSTRFREKHDFDEAMFVSDMINADAADWGATHGDYPACGIRELISLLLPLHRVLLPEEHHDHLLLQSYGTQGRRMQRREHAFEK